MTLRRRLGKIKRVVENRGIKRIQRFIRIWRGQEANIRPELICNRLRLGSEYGGWTFCPDFINSESIVYSVGIGHDISFDLALIERYGVQVIGLDPTPSCIQWLQKQPLPPQFHHFAYAIGPTDAEVAFHPPRQEGNISYSFLNRGLFATEPIYVPARRIQTVMQEFQHDYIDLLKLDIEGAEYQVIDDLVSYPVPIKQLLVEFHHRLPEIGFAATQRAVMQLHRIGFRLFAVSPSGEEYSFLRHL